jgi:Domain of unknown function (DUF4416)
LGQIRPVPPVKLFVSVLTSIPSLLPEVEAELTALLGPIDLCSETFPFDSTHYYDRVMGSPLSRSFFAFAGLILPSALAGIKLGTNRLEEALAHTHPSVERPVNLDPGYLEESKAVLASTKNFFHRIHIGEGIYAEVTLHWQGGRWQYFPWTFPDFRTGRYEEFFSQLRRVYRDQLK